MVKGSTINGGDLGYLYRGTFEMKPGELSASLNVKRWNQYTASIFGNISEFDLQISGEISRDQKTIIGVGHVIQNPQMQFTFNAHRIADAA